MVTRVSARGTTDDLSGLAIQRDGKLVAAGSSDVGVTLVRYNIDGSLDTSFGIQGISKKAIGNYVDVFAAVVIQPDGKF